MKLFEGLRKIRDFERGQLAFLTNMVDFDLVIEIGYAEEMGQPLTLKQLLLMEISSRSTIRRNLARLIEGGVVLRRKSTTDQRANELTISAASLKLLGKYGAALCAISSQHFK